MNKHEQHDPRRGRESAEKARQDRTAIRLVLVIAVLAGAVLTVWLRQMSAVALG